MQPPFLVTHRISRNLFLHHWQRPQRWLEGRLSPLESSLVCQNWNKPHWSNSQGHVVAPQVWNSRGPDKEVTDPKWLPVQHQSLDRFTAVQRPRLSNGFLSILKLMGFTDADSHQQKSAAIIQQNRVPCSRANPTGWARRGEAWECISSQGSDAAAPWEPCIKEPQSRPAVWECEE